MHHHTTTNTLQHAERHMRIYTVHVVVDAGAVSRSAACWSVCCMLLLLQVLVFMSGLLPDPETNVAVMGLSTQLSLLPWMFCYSLGTATATRVAQALGGGSATRAAKISK